MDERVFFLINHTWTHPAVDRLMAAASSFDLWLPLILVIAVLTAWRGGRRARICLLCLGLTLAVSDGVVGNTLKHAFHRLRPYQTVQGVRQLDFARRARPRILALFRPLDVHWSVNPDQDPPARDAARDTGRSFPSSHVMNNVCAAVVLALFYRRWGWLYFGPATLVAYSRVYVGSHWPSDVIVSAFLAAAVALWMLLLLQWTATRTGWTAASPP